jgi:hypothetical protein
VRSSTKPSAALNRKGQRQGGEEGQALAVDQHHQAIAAGHGEGAVRQVDEVHQAERDGQPTGQHEQQHAVGYSIEQNGQHLQNMAEQLEIAKARGDAPSPRASGTLPTS